MNNFEKISAPKFRKYCRIFILGKFRVLNIKIFKILRKKGALINNRKREENAKFIVFWRIYDVRSVPLFALGKRNKFDLWLKNAKLVDLINRNPAPFFFAFVSFVLIALTKLA